VARNLALRSQQRPEHQTTDEVTFWSVNGQKLAVYQLTEDPGIVNQAPPSFYATQTGTCYYFGGKMIKNEKGWVYTDRLGSIGKFYPYGVERPSATANGTEKFTGYFRDAETGLDYADQRYQSPGTGRFMTPDRMGGNPADPGSWNKYAYVGGDPVNFIDPEGKVREVPPTSIWLPDPIDITFFQGGAGGGSGSTHQNPVGEPGIGEGPVLGPIKTIDDAGARASDRISSEDCASLFLAPGFRSPEDRAVLSNLFTEFVATIRTLGASQVADGPSVPAFTTDAHGLTYIVLGGAFFTGTLNGKPLLGAFSGLTLNEDQELILIHEFLHYEGVVGPDKHAEKYRFPDGTTAIGSDGISAEIRKHSF
jgi:RHS repeat-associated protein